LESLPLHSRLADPGRFDREALLFRAVKPLIEAIRQATSPVSAELQCVLAGQKWTNTFLSRLAYSLSVADPAQWIACPHCKGTGTDATGSDTCQYCQGARFEIVEDEELVGVCDDDVESADE